MGRQRVCRGYDGKGLRRDDCGDERGGIDGSQSRRGEQPHDEGFILEGGEISTGDRGDIGQYDELHWYCTPSDCFAARRAAGERE